MACNSSGVITTTTSQITPDRCKLISVHASKASGTGTIRIFDGSSTSGKEIVRILFDAAKQTAIEFDMHGAIANDGLFLDNPDAIPVSVEFA